MERIERIKKWIKMASRERKQIPISLPGDKIWFKGKIMDKKDK